MVQQHCWLGAANRRTHSGAGTDRKGRTNRWRWSPCRHLVDPRWLQLSSSQWTSSFNSDVPKEETFLFLGVHWCYQVNTHWSGCVTRKEDWRLLECRLEQKFVRFLDRIFKVHSIERKNLHKDTCGPEGEWQKFTRRPNPDYGQEVSTRIGNAAQNREKTRIGKRETGARQCSKNERILLYWSRCQGIFGNSVKKRKKKTGKAHHQIARRICLRSPKLHPRRIPKQCMSV